MKRPLPVDKTDLVSLPLFVATMLAEAAVLRRRPELRAAGDVDDWTKDQLADPSPTPDEFVPVGYERNDTRTSLTMLAGNIALTLSWAGPKSGGSSTDCWRNKLGHLWNRPGWMPS